MNFKISEKEVLYRINNNKKQKSIGEYIRKERLAQGLKQEVVCKDICSVSYYSRIESNKVVPSEIYIKKIFNKLNKPVPKILDYDYNQKIRQIINNFLTAIEYKNDNNVEEEYNNLKNIPELNLDLYNFIYLIYFKEIKHLKPLILKLHQQQIYFDNEELLLYLEHLGTYYVLNNKIDKADKYLSMALKLQKNIGVIKPSILYRYAWVLGKKNNNYQCINYAEEADKIYTERNNIYRSIQCKMLIVIKLRKFFPNKAIEIYKNIILITKQNKYSCFERICRYNLAILLKKNNHLSEAEEYFLKMLKDYGNDVNFKFKIYVEYIDILFYLNKYNKIKKYFEELKDLKLNTDIYNFYIKYYDCKLNIKIDYNKIQIYKNELIPSSIIYKNSSLELRLRKEYVYLLEKTNNFKEAIIEYKRILKLSEII